MTGGIDVRGPNDAPAPEIPAVTRRNALDSSTTFGRGPRAVAGVTAAASALAVTVLADGVSVATPSLVLGVGQAVIRLAPGSAARSGVETFGTADKPLLVVGIVVVCLLLGGAAAVRGRASFAAAVVAAASVAVLAAVRVTDAAVLPSVGAGLASALSGLVVHDLLRAAGTAGSTAQNATGATLTRRWFLGASTGAAGGAALVAVTGRMLLRAGAADAARAAVVLPEPVSGVGADAAAAALPAPGISALVTPNGSFYRIDEALVVPTVDLGSWALRVTGLTSRTVALTYDALLELPMIERYITLACVSNEVGGRLVGNARWLGVPLADILDRAGVDPSADQLVGRSVDGFTVGFPTRVALDGRDALVAVGMNGEPLPRRHGFPARLVVPGLYGYVSATKWLTEIELTTFDAFDAYWVRRGWSPLGPVKVQSRIDVPRHRARVRPGPVTVAGVAWAQHRGVEAVEVSIDDGSWRPADLSRPLSVDAWRQWALPWDALPGRHRLSVRATTASGEVQDPERRPVFPDGATGHHTITVDVRDA